MAYLCIRNSLRIEGADFSEDEATNRMIQDPDLFSVVLYPGPGATNLSMVPASQRAAFVPTGRELNVFVLDGTWKTAGKMIRLSRNLQVLPLVCFVPPTPSAFRIRRQPHPDCYSTIEAIHHVIDLFAPTENENPAKPRPHDNLLAVFGTAVSRQLYYHGPFVSLEECPLHRALGSGVAYLSKYLYIVMRGYLKWILCVLSRPWPTRSGFAC